MPKTKNTYRLYKIGSNEDKLLAVKSGASDSHCFSFLMGHLNCIANGKEVVFKDANPDRTWYTVDGTDYEIREESEHSQTTTETQLMNALQNMLEQADEDCPVEYRTDHFRDALADGWALINTLNKGKHGQES